MSFAARDAARQKEGRARSRSETNLRNNRPSVSRFHTVKVQVPEHDGCKVPATIIASILAA